MVSRESSTSSSVSMVGVAAAAAIASASVTYLIMRSTSATSGGCGGGDSKGKKEAEKEIVDNQELSTASLKRSPTIDMHTLNPTLQMAGRASVARTPTAYFRNQPNATHVIRIVLTGGPCAGKSSALAHVRSKATAEGFDVYCAPEVATLFLNSGVQFAKNPQEIFAFQKAICSLQLSLERNLTRIVQGTGRPSIIIFDRGLLDSKGYVLPNKQAWERILSELTTSGATDTGHSSMSIGQGVSEEYCLKRYDGVVHLVTAADGADEYYKCGSTGVTDDSGNPVVRHETKEQALALDYKMRDCWKAHPQHHIIGNTGTFEDKLDATVKVILKLAEETHAVEVSRARVLHRVMPPAPCVDL